MKNLKLIFALTLLSLFAGNTYAQEHNDYDDLKFMLGDKYQTKLSKLKRASNSEQQVWSAYFWPNYTGGIAMRWDAKLSDYKNPPAETNPHNYQLITEMKFDETVKEMLLEENAKKVKKMSEKKLAKFLKKQIKKIKKSRSKTREVYKQVVMNLSEAELASLSAAEKYDIFKQRFDFPTVQSERKRTDPNGPRWTGLCNGWAAATIKYDEPNQVEHVLDNKKTLRFYSADIKSLLAYHEVNFNQKASYLGLRCNSKLNDNARIASTEPGCNGINPGAFHIMLGNRIGIKRKSFVMDRDGGPEVWNHPVFAYDAKLTKKSENKYHVQTTVWFLQEMAPYEYPISDSITNGMGIEYELDLDDEGNIIGGKWLSFEKPDFAWLPGKTDFSEDKYYKNIGDLYQQSLTDGDRRYALEDLVDEVEF